MLVGAPQIPHQSITKDNWTTFGVLALIRKSAQMSALRAQQKFSIAQSFARFALAFSVAALGIVLPAPAHALTFDMTGVVFNFNHTTANTTYKNIVGTGTANNDVVLYYNVGTVSGTSIDAVVTTVIVNGEAPIISLS